MPCSFKTDAKVRRLVDELGMRLVWDEERPVTEGTTRLITWQLLADVQVQYVEDSRTASEGMLVIGTEEASVPFLGRART